METTSGLSGVGAVSNRLPAVLDNVEYDAELEFLCRTAAWVGTREGSSAPLSFTAILVAFLIGRDPVSIWFQRWVEQQGIDREGILQGKGVRDLNFDEEIRRASSNLLPQASTLYSTSATNIFRAAVEIAGSVTATPLGLSLVLGTRHVMAAYAFATPADHLQQIQRWRFNAGEWQSALLLLLLKVYPTEKWGALQPRAGIAQKSAVDTLIQPPTAEMVTGSPSARAGSEPGFAKTESPSPSPPSQVPIPRREILIGRYTADDPYSTADDLLNIEDEAGAFARIVAARDIRPPLAIGIFGEWGAGKTYFMRRIQDRVDGLRLTGSANEPGNRFYRDIVQIRFNAWHYIETNLWASLVEYIFSALDSWMQTESGNDPKSTDLVFNRLATAQQLQIDALERVVTQRAEQHNAELRAERARKDYAEALARSERVRPDAYFRALVETFLDEKSENRKDLSEIGTELAIPELADASDRLTRVIAESRSDAGHDRLLFRALFKKLGSFRVLLTLILLFLVLPAILTLIKQSLAEHGYWLKSLHDATAEWTVTLLAVAGYLNHLRAGAAAALSRLDKFNNRLQMSIEEQLKSTRHSRKVEDAIVAEKELQNKKQALEAAKNSLADANSRLAAARQEFESGTARSRLNAFIRAKVTDGAYAKHLGIIASIRKDFVQLASLMSETHSEGEEQREREKLRQEAKLRVRRFLEWVSESPEVRLTESEVQSLLVLLDPEDVLEILQFLEASLNDKLDCSLESVRKIAATVQSASHALLPRFSRIVLYIDDLDRCPPDKVVEVLQAVHLLLCFPLFVVVVAVDARWVSRALYVRFSGLLDEPGTNSDLPLSGASSLDYLEKIFQIPYWVRPMDEAVAQSYVEQIASGDLARAQPPPSRLAQTSTPGAQGDGGPPPRPTVASSSGEALMPPEVNASSALSPPITVGLTLSPFEISLLKAYAPHIGRTPRQAIRFVNVYRLIKTSLNSELLKRLDVLRGESPEGRALVPQLAIVTGAPRSTAEYFRRLGLADDAKTVADFSASLRGKDTDPFPSDWHLVTGVMETWASSEAALPVSVSKVTVKDMRFIAKTVRRYSFTANVV